MKHYISKLYLLLLFIFCILIAISCSWGSLESYDDEGDTIPPAAPTNVVANATPDLGITLSWDASADNTKVIGYWIHRVDKGLIDTVKDTWYHQSWLSPNTQYCYVITAHDFYGNVSPLSNTACATTNIEVGKYPSIAIDSNDNVHISYYDQSYNKIKYAENIIQGWGIENIDYYQEYINATSIAIGSNNKVHISYTDKNPLSLGKLYYATNATGSWIISTIAAGSYNASIAIDSNDKVHISYSGGGLK